MKSESYLIDCMDFMRQIPDKYFDLAIVDPPYSETFNTDACADNKGKKGSYKLDTLNNHLPTEEYWNELFRVSKNQIVWGANWYGKYFGVGGLVWFKDNTGNYSPCEYAYQSINNHIHHYQYRWNGMLQQNMKQKMGQEYTQLKSQLLCMNGFTTTIFQMAAKCLIVTLAQAATVSQPTKQATLTFTQLKLTLTTSMIRKNVSGNTKHN